MSLMSQKGESLVLSRREPGAAAEAFIRLLQTPSGAQGLYWSGGEFIVWQGGRWRVYSLEELMDVLLLTLKDATYEKKTEEGVRRVRVSPSVGFVDDTLRFVQAMTRRTLTMPAWTSEVEGDPDPQWCVAFNDVVVDVRNWAAYERNERWLGTTVLDMDWVDVKEAVAPRWLKCVEEWSCGDENWGPLLQMVMGYAVVPTRRLRKCVLIQGETGGGKGVIQHVVRRMLGRALQVTNMETLADKHGTVGLGSAQVLWVPEVTKGGREKARTSARLIKEIVGEDPITVNPKFGQVERNVACRALVVMTSNVVPQLENDRGGLTNKMLMLPIRKSFDKGGAEVGLKDRLVDREMAGIVRWAMEGARRLAEQVETGGVVWPVPELSREMEEQFIAENNPVGLFQSVCFVRDQHGFVASELVRAEWIKWQKVRLKGREVEGVSEHNIVAKMLEQGMWGVRRHRQGSGGRRGLAGLMLRQEWRVE